MSSYFQPLADYFLKEHGLTFRADQLADIEQICARLGAPKTIPETPVSRFTRLLNKQDNPDT